MSEASGGRFGSYTQAIYDVWDDFAKRRSGRRGGNNFAGRRLLFGVSAEEAFAAGWLPKRKDQLRILRHNTARILILTTFDLSSG